MITTERSLIKYVIFSILTLGIYSWYFLYKLAEDLNVLCAGDGKQTSGLIKFILLTIVTCGIYSWFWYYNVGNRLAENAPKYGLNFSENGTSVIMWMIFGAFLCGIGPFIAINIIIKNTNALAVAYNAKS